MDLITNSSVTATPAKTPQPNRSKIKKAPKYVNQSPNSKPSNSESPKDENENPNLRSPSLKSSKSPIIKSASKTLKSATKNPNNNSTFSPKNKIRERKFVIVAKRNSKREKTNLANLVCNCKDKIGNKCLCVAYEVLRASQEEFFKPKAEEHGTKISVLETNDPKEILEIGEMGSKRKMEQENETGIDVWETKRPSEEKDVTFEPGSGKVMSLIKAFERLKTATPESKDVNHKDERESEGTDKKGANWELQITAPKTQISSSSISPLVFLVRSQSSVSSSLDSSQGSFIFSTKGSCIARRSRRNSIESTGTFEGRQRRRKQKQLKATRQQPFKLLTEQRGKNKEEEFTKKLQEMKIEEEKQRIPIAQGLPWTTDEPENLVKPPVKEITRPVDLVLHSDMRAEERAEFDQQLAEKEALIEQYRMEKERQRKMAEEEEIRRLRKELVPKAQPMPYFDRPFIPRRSEKQPTIPREPKFHLPDQKKIKSCLSWDGFYSFQ